MKRLLLLLLLLPVSLHGAAFVNSQVGGDTIGSGDRTLLFTPSSGALGIVCFQLAQNTNSSTTVTDNNSDGLGTYYKVFMELNNSSTDIGGCFIRQALFSNATNSTVTINSGSNTSGEIVFINISGMTRTGSSAVRQYKSQANGTTTAPSLDFDAACLTGNLTIEFTGSNNTSGSSAGPPAGWTEHRDVGQITPNATIQVSTRASGFTGTNVAWTTISGGWNAGIIELDDSGLGSPFHYNKIMRQSQ